MAVAAVAQMVEREATSLDKDFNSNTSVWDCDVAGSNPASAKAFGFSKV